MENGPIKVLLVEDNPDDVALVQAMMDMNGTEGIELTPVVRLGEALQRLREEDFQVVLLDLNLPDGFGLDTFLKLHGHAPEVPVVVLTGLADEGVGALAVQAGAQDYLIKGQVDGPTLKRSLRACL